MSPYKNEGGKVYNTKNETKTALSTIPHFHIGRPVGILDSNYIRTYHDNMGTFFKKSDFKNCTEIHLDRIWFKFC